MSVKLISAAVVLLVGFALASLFPNREQATDSELAPAGVTLRRAASEPQRKSADRSPAGESLPALEAAAMPEMETPATRLAATRADRDSFRSPPPRPSNFAAAVEQGTSPLAAIERPLQPVATRHAANELPREIVHRVEDGDTLAGLATRYLGDAAAADRIRRANRDRLPSNPNWLPIGVELRIPTAAVDAPGQPATVARFDTAETRLVPVEPVPVVAETHAR